MWFFRAALLGFAAQLPFLSRPPPQIPFPMSTRREFRLKTGSDRFTPKDLIELPRPGAATANVAGDLVLTPVSKYSFAEKK
jgi:hypothetical protein